MAEDVRVQHEVVGRGGVKDRMGRHATAGKRCRKVTVFSLQEGFAGSPAMQACLSAAVGEKLKS